VTLIKSRNNLVTNIPDDMLQMKIKDIKEKYRNRNCINNDSNNLKKQKMEEEILKVQSLKGFYYYNINIIIL